MSDMVVKTSATGFKEKFYRNIPKSQLHLRRDFSQVKFLLHRRISFSSILYFGTLVSKSGGRGKNNTFVIYFQNTDKYIA